MRGGEQSHPPATSPRGACFPAKVHNCQRRKRSKFATEVAKHYGVCSEMLALPDQEQEIVKVKA